MDKSNDWRLLNDVDFLKGQYLEPLTSNEMLELFPNLNHCVFCWEKAPKEKLPYNQIWFVTEKGDSCVCEQCFLDFEDYLDLKQTDDFF